MDKSQFSLVTLTVVVGVVFTDAARAQSSPPDTAWELSIGAGFFTGPAFEGAKTYQVSALPSVRLNYKNIFFASIEGGVGANVLSSNTWRAGPLFRLAFPRDEDGGSSPFRICGKTTTALQGLGGILVTPEPGAFVEYQWNDWSARVEARHGIGGHSGAVGSVGLTYTKSLHPQGHVGGPPIILSLGVNTSFVSDKYAQTFFGVTLAQSVNSGLSEFDATGGLHSYGTSALAVVPIARNVYLTGLVSFSRLAGDAAGSPLVRERGSKSQATVGVFVAYQFGW